MALNRWRRRFEGNERVDLPDFRTMMDRAFEDFKLLIKTFIDNSSQPRVPRRYIQGAHSANVFRLKKDFNRALVDTNQEWLYVNTDAANTTHDLAVLSNTTNYIEVRILIANDDLQTRAFWDTDIGLTGEEFFDQINVRTRIDEDFSINQSGFQGGIWIPLFEVDVDAGGTITDVREMDDALWKPRAFTLPAATARANVFMQSVQDLRTFIDFIGALMSEAKGTGQSLESQPWSNFKLLREYQNIYFTGGGEIDWEATGGADTLTIGADIGISIAGRATGFTVPSGAHALQEGECLYVDIPETGSGPLTPTIDDLADVPINPTAAGHSPRIMVLFYRTGGKIYGTMDIPELDSGETAVIGQDLPKNIRTRLGITGETSVEAYSAQAIASGIIGANDSYPAAISKLATRTSLLKVDLIDLGVTSVLPTGAPVTIDGNPVTDQDDVLFTHPTLNGIYRATVVAGDVTAWVQQTVFNGSVTPADGDEVSVIGGTDYLQMVFRYNVTFGWKPLNTSQLEHEPTGFVDRAESEILFDEGTRTFTIQPLADKFDYVSIGKIYRKAAPQSVVIPDVSGLYYVYFDGSTLVQNTSYSYDIIKRYAFVATIYWHSPSQKAVALGDERHGLVLDGATHRYLHETIGTRWVRGLSLGNFSTSGDGTDDTHMQASLSDGLIFDEDIDIEPVNAASPTDPFEQVLDPIAQIPVLYREGAGGEWRIRDAGDFPVLNDNSGIFWNNPSGPWTEDSPGDNEFVASWIFATNDPRHPIIAIAGQRVDASLSDAQANNKYESLLFGDLPSLEMKVLYRLIFEYDSANFANTLTARLVDVRDLRQAIDTSLAAFSASDHGGLSGLNDPDHGPTAVTTTGVTKDGGLSDSDVDVKESLDTLNKLFGQMRLKPHPTLLKRVVVTGAERVLNSGTTLVQTLKSLVADFEGAEIDFETGEIFKSDGATPLGIDFTPFSVPSSEFFFYSVHLVASTVNPNNSIQAQILIIPASGSNAALADAPRPAFAKGATPIGTVYVVGSGAGIANITAANIGQLGSGVGSGSGGSFGAGAQLLEMLADRLDDGFLEWMTPNVFEIHEDDRVDVLSDGTYDIANSVYKLESGDLLISTQMYGSRFLSLQQENLSIELIAEWLDTAIDDAAIYRVSQDGGVIYEDVTMERIGDSARFRGVVTLTTQAGDIISEYDVINANTTAELNATTRQSYAIKQPAVPAGAKRRTTTGIVYINKTGSPVGELRVKLVADNGGVPGATILGQNKSYIDIASLSAGDNVVAIDIPAIITAQTYWLVIETSAAYKAGFSAGVTSIAARVDTTTPSYAEGDSYQYDGSTWSAHAGNQATFQLSGFDYDLRVQIEASQTASLVGYGVFYGESSPVIYDTEQSIQRFDVDGDDNQTEFTITKFIPDPMKLRVYNANTGQVFRYPSFDMDGRKIVFSSGQFLSPGETIILLFDQSEQGAFDNSDLNAALLASNGLGSTDPSVDRSSPGVGMKLRSPDGQLWHVTVTNAGGIVTTAL